MAIPQLVAFVDKLPFVWEIPTPVCAPVRNDTDFDTVNAIPRRGWLCFLEGFMTVTLPRRLEICAGFVPEGCRVADVGCDHGYLAIHLIQSAKASMVYASDIRQQPLQSAVRNAKKYGVEKQIQFFLSDGVEALPRDFDCMVCAGMGGDTMISILEAAPWLKNAQYRLVLQCQSKRAELRKYLSDAGWYIEEERVVRDGKFLYSVMNVMFAPEKPRLSPMQCHFPPVLRGGDVPAYYQYVRTGLEIAVQHRPDAENTAILKELTALLEED